MQDNKKIIKTAALIIYDNKNRILLNQRTLDAKRNPGKWSFFGGHIEKGESALKAVIREAKEELNLKVKKPRLLFISKINNRRIYVFVKPKTKSMMIKQSEGASMKWYVIQDSLKLNLSNEVKKTLKVLIQKNLLNK